MKLRKADDGYILVYVLIVFLVLSLTAVMICSASLSNLKSQHASVERTQALYEVEGRVEAYVAKACTLRPSGSVAGTDVGAAARTGYVAALSDVPTDGMESVTCINDELMLCAKAGNVKIDATVEVDLSYSWSESDYTYQVTDVKMKYISYNISYLGGDAA